MHDCFPSLSRLNHDFDYVFTRYCLPIQRIILNLLKESKIHSSFLSSSRSFNLTLLYGDKGGDLFMKGNNVSLTCLTTMILTISFLHYLSSANTRKQCSCMIVPTYFFQRFIVDYSKSHVKFHLKQEPKGPMCNFKTP